MRTAKRDLPVHITALRVKAHQDKPTTREGRLNNIVDRLASIQHNQAGTWASRPTSIRLPNTNAQLVLNGEHYTGKIDRAIQSDAYRGKMEDFINSKLDIVRMRQYIDWDALRWHHRELLPHRRARRLKIIY